MPDFESLLTRLIEHHVDFVILDTDLGQLDCLGMITGLGDFEQAKAHSVEISLPSGPCRVLSLDALITAKAAMGRPRDREVVDQLRAIKARQDGRRDCRGDEQRVSPGLT